MINIDHQVSTVDRRVGDRVIDAGQARTTTVSQSYRATVDDVWDACTNPHRLPRWFLPISGDLRLHGHFQLEGNAGGTILECDPPHRFMVTWEYGEQTSWLEVRVHPEGDEHARLEIEHISLEDDHWVEFGPAAVGIGWDLALVGLSLHLGGAPAVDPQESAAWMASDDGKRFVRECSEQWRTAHVAAGADPATAQACAERTAAFYTGETAGG